MHVDANRKLTCSIWSTFSMVNRASNCTTKSRSLCRLNSRVVRLPPEWWLVPISGKATSRRWGQFRVIQLQMSLCRGLQTCSEPCLEEGSDPRPGGSRAWPRGKKSSHAEAEKEKAKQHDCQQNDKWATYSGAKGKSHNSRVARHPPTIVNYFLKATCRDFR